MSYDVSIGKESFNYTYNVSKLFYDHIDGGINSLHGMTGKEAAKTISSAFDKITQAELNHWRHDVSGEPEFCALYDSPNGWGSTVGGILFLVNIMKACYDNPRSKVHVS